MGAPRAARAQILGGLLLILATISGCGHEADSDRETTGDESRATATPSSSVADPSPQDAEPSSGSTEVAADPEARKALRSAFLRLARANSGRFEVIVASGSANRVHEQGRYQLSPMTFDVVRELSGPEGSLRMAYRAVGDESWVRLESGTSDEGPTPGWPCWVNYADIAGMRGFPVEIAQTPKGQPPAAVVAASWGVGRRAIDAQSIEGTMDLVLAAGLVSGKLVVTSGIDVQGDDTVPATFSIDRRMLSGFTVSMADLLQGIEAAGGELPFGDVDLGSVPGDVTTRFFDFGATVNVQAPPAGELLTLRNAEDLESAMQSCGGS